MGGIIGTGSPLDARQSPLPYTVLLIALFVIGILFVIWVISKIIKKHHESPAYIERQKKRVTRLADVRALGNKINLSRAEMASLFTICRKEKMPNVYYTWTEPEIVDSVFQKEYQRLKNLGGTYEEINSLFKLRNHLERILLIKKSVSSSHSIPVGEKLVLTATDGVRHEFKIVKNEKDHLFLELPQGFEKLECCPKPLMKIMMSYSMGFDMKYVLATRVVRFQPGPGNTKQMVVQHANTVSMQSRRMYKRVDVDIPCSFRAVEERHGRRGSVTYIPKENKYDGTLLNLSAGGCSIKGNLPIKRNQKLWIELNLPGHELIECCGLIVDMRQKNNVYSLHIAFLDITHKDRNEIFAFIYKYD